MTDRELVEYCERLSVLKCEIEEVARQLQSQYDWQRERDNEIRQFVWAAHAYSPGSWEFWRHGMQARYRAAFEEGDCDSIYGFDETAMDTLEAFPELRTLDVNPSQALFDFLQTPYLRHRPIRDFYEEAVRYFESKTMEVPF